MDTESTLLDLVVVYDAHGPVRTTQQEILDRACSFEFFGPFRNRLTCEVEIICEVVVKLELVGLEPDSVAVVPVRRTVRVVG